ncbi:hypothetical protein RCL_jg278.t1 [Rhizophagus clarus]|uniref:Uncharacterized protein n=1 Tax=Rhizophagus clarus TaxID=94130 RepID=A0A8H3QXB5_9GLOM|nr:hypothetical protein RCL_jg278.t1 [Rhizophagus clarus]
MTWISSGMLSLASKLVISKTWNCVQVADTLDEPRLGMCKLPDSLDELGLKIYINLVKLEISMIQIDYQINQISDEPTGQTGDTNKSSD